MSTIPAQPARPRTKPWLLALAPVALIALACWWFTEPLGKPPVATTAAQPVASTRTVAERSAVSSWPAATLDGEPAKRLLLRFLQEARERLERVEGYTATFHKQERIKGRLGPEQTMAMKVRNRPFAVYFKFLAPRAGKEVVFAEGRHDGKVIAHNGDWTRRLIPRLAVAPTDRLALADSRHPITDAGLVRLTEKLIAFRRLDLEDDEAVTILDRTTTDDGTARLRSIHTHPNKNDDRPFARVEILYDPVTGLPVSISSFEWPRPGRDGPLDLAEHYAYHDLRLDVPLTDLDFDPANPAYAFSRY
ncbi:MAG TPA: DUF1571 domain-containing protein [Isosphaeraceae bacterium]|nr:DUF1571 domain-containing protein [Isosphaeraceae bacterium]